MTENSPIAEKGVQLARRVFKGAGVYGVIVLVPQYFMEGKLGRDFPPPVTHPEQYYGFIGIALAWQVVFLLIAKEPVRYRPLMAAGVLEKLAFGGAAVVLYLQGRLAAPILGVGLLDLVLGSLFAWCFWATRGADKNE